MARVFFFSGIVLPVLCFLLVFLMLALATLGVDVTVWQRFTHLLIWALVSISAYYMVIAFISWQIQKMHDRKKAKLEKEKAKSAAAQKSVVAKRVEMELATARKNPVAKKPLPNPTKKA